MSEVIRRRRKTTSGTRSVGGQTRGTRREGKTVDGSEEDRELGLRRLPLVTQLLKTVKVI